MRSATNPSDEPIVTKLYPAQAGRSIIVRARLLDMLRRAADTPLSLIVAPAGYGKTTLLSSWAALVTQRGAGCAWLSLDGGDNDAARFWAALAAAFERADPPIAARLQPLLGSLAPPAADRLVAALLNACAARDEPIVLALDDFHVIENPALIDAVALLVDRAPPTLRLAIASRTEPPLPLPRWRVRGSVAEIKAADLRFSADETGRLVAAHGARLSTDAAVTLAERTEGWAAALVLATHGELYGQSTPIALQRDLFDYVVAEVLARQTPMLRSFLLRTSLPERLCAPLCDELSGQTGSEATLDWLERNNLFVVRLDEHGRWFRYHHLFAAALRAELTRSGFVGVEQLHGRAASWFERHGLLREAIEHTLAAADWTSAARLVASEARPAMLRGEIASVTGWLRALPSEQLAQTPELLLIAGWLRVLDGDLAAADEHARAARAIAKLDATSQVAAELAALAIMVAALRAEPLALDSSAPVHTADPFLRSILFLGQGFAAFWNGDLAAAERAFTAAANAGSQHGTLVTVIALCQRGDVQIKRAALRQAEASFHEALALAEPDLAEVERASTPLSGFVLIGLGMLAAERGDNDTGRRRLRQGIALCEHWGGISTFDAYLALARLQAATGDTAAADTAFNSATAISRRLRLGYTTPLLEAAAAELAANAGRLEVARAWLASIANPPSLGSGPLVDETVALAAARMCILLGCPGEAIERLATVLQHAEAGGRIRTAIEAHILAAQSQLAHVERGEARAHLLRALELAAPDRIVAPFAGLAGPAGELLGELGLSAGRDSAVYALLAQLDALHHAAPIRHPDDLSAREQEVLALLAAGLSNTEIAGRLVVARSTIKKHVNHIFAKLGAGSRAEALARARERGLVP